MKLYADPEFRQTIIQASQFHNVMPQFVEKDYYVTEILRIIATTLPGKTIFKGGTSLSKGWKLISRFSEDIDLFIDRNKFDPPLSGNALTRQLRSLCLEIGEYGPLERLIDERRGIKGKERQETYRYRTKFDDLIGILPDIRLEAGIQSGTFPTEERQITSYVGEFLQNKGMEDLAEDIAGFPMSLLHFRRTFVEKLFALHGYVEQFQAGDLPTFGPQTRHYGDLYVLAKRPEVIEMLQSDEYLKIKEDYDSNSREHFDDRYLPPKNLSFKESKALFPSVELRATIESRYNVQCRLLFSTNDFPTFENVLSSFADIRELL